MAVSESKPGNSRLELHSQSLAFVERLFADLGRVSGVEPPALKLPPPAALRLAQLSEAGPGRAVISVDEVRSVSQWWTYSSAKAKRELGWKPRYASWRQGFAQGLG
jgi:hypothetical protein